MPMDLDVARKKLDEERARLDARDARLQEKERTRDTRRKIVVGGRLLGLARSKDDQALQVLRRVLSSVQPRDAGLVAGLVAEFGDHQDPPNPADSSSAGEGG